MVNIQKVYIYFVDFTNFTAVIVADQAMHEIVKKRGLTRVNTK